MHLPDLMKRQRHFTCIYKLANMNIMGMTDYIVEENTNFAQYFLFENRDCTKISLRQNVSSPWSAKICLR